MKANELMVGDWVKPFGSNEDVFAKITSITPNRIDMVTTGKNPHNEVAEYIYPIPLTTEILEKNGIKWLSTEPSGRRTYCCNKPVIHCTYFPNSGWLVCVGACGSNKVRFVEISKVQYVHELQHALRLCGIDDKEIEL